MLPDPLSTVELAKLRANGRTPEENLAEYHRQVAAFNRERTSTVPRGLRRSLAALDRDEHSRDAIFQANAWRLQDGRQGQQRGLVLTGGWGVGKTSIAAAAAWERSLEHPVIYVSVPLLMQNMARAFNDVERAAALAALTGRGGLVLDDLDKGKASEWSSAQLLAAIDSRIQDDRPLLVTMNTTLGRLAEKLGREYGGAIVSRLTGYCEVVTVGGPDRRLARGRG